MKGQTRSAAALVGSALAFAACAPSPARRETVVRIAEPPPREDAPPEPAPERAPPRRAAVDAPPPMPVEEGVEDLSDESYVTGGVVGGIPAGVPGGVPGGVVVPGGVPGGVVGGVPGGVPWGVPGGVVGGVASGPPPSPKASLMGSSAWTCAFPPEADAAKVDSAVVTLIVVVSAAGAPLKVAVIQDPGNGFGRAARDCALARTYKAAVDDQGKPIAASTPPIKVRFSR